MSATWLVVGACLLGLVGCQEPGAPLVVGQNPAAPSAGGATVVAGATSAVRPWKADLQWRVTGLSWPDQPFSGVKSLFDGRCSVPSDYIVTAHFEGEATHVGRFSGDGAHCSQIAWTPQGPGGVTYSDGEGSLVAANGSRLALKWGHGVSGVDPETGETWFKDTFTFEGGTGNFTGASGGGEEGGRFADFAAVLSGTPAPMWQTGTITYGPGNR
jgi:hypothetical protein